MWLVTSESIYILKSKLLKDACFSGSWKIVVRPLIKKCNLHRIDENFRPVSYVAFVSKLIERAVLDQLNWHCTYNVIHSVFQSAYKANHSYETASLKFVNDMLWTMEHTQVTTLVAVDLSATFDTINHMILFRSFQKQVWNSRWFLLWYPLARKKRIKKSQNIKINASIFKAIYKMCPFVILNKLVRLLSYWYIKENQVLFIAIVPLYLYYHYAPSIFLHQHLYYSSINLTILQINIKMFKCSFVFLILKEVYSDEGKAYNISLPPDHY